MRVLPSHPIIILGILLLGSLPATTHGTDPTETSEHVSFSNGAVALSGTLYLPKGGPRHPAVVAFHSANGGTRDFHAYQHLATSLPAAGIAVLLFDRRGSGASSGDFTTASFQDLAADGIAGIGLLKARDDIDPSRIGVWGVSQGGWLGPLAASMSRDIAFVVSVSGPGVSPAKQMNFAVANALRRAGQSPAVVSKALQVRDTVDDYFRGRLTKDAAEQAIASIRQERWFGDVFLGSGGLPDDPARTKWYLEMDYDPLDALARVQVPIAFFFAPADAWVAVDESISAIRRATRFNAAVTIRTIADADHLMETGPPDSGGPVSRKYLNELLVWLRERVEQ